MTSERCWSEATPMLRPRQMGSSACCADATASAGTSASRRASSGSRCSWRRSGS